MHIDIYIDSTRLERVLERCYLEYIYIYTYIHIDIYIDSTRLERVLERCYLEYIHIYK